MLLVARLQFWNNLRGVRCDVVVKVTFVVDVCDGFAKTAAGLCGVFALERADGHAVAEKELLAE